MESQLVLPSKVSSLAESVKDEVAKTVGETSVQGYEESSSYEETGRHAVSQLVVSSKVSLGGTWSRSEDTSVTRPLLYYSQIQYGGIDQHEFLDLHPEVSNDWLGCDDGAKKPIRSPLDTYTRDPPWPHSHIHRLRPEIMVNAGFIYTGKEDIVQCQTCFLQVGKWLEKTALEPLVVHRREQPRCPFVQGQTSGIRMPPMSMPVPMMANGYYSNLYEQLVSPVAKGSGRRDFSRFSRRLDSFREYDTSLPVSKYPLADAGFFLVKQPDFTECFACGIVLNAWEEGDEPMKEHKRLAPNCSYVKTVEKAEAEMRRSSPQPIQPSVSAGAMQWDRRQTGLESQFTGMSVEATPLPKDELSGRDAHMEMYRPPPLHQGNLTATLEPQTTTGVHRRHAVHHSHFSSDGYLNAPILYPPTRQDAQKRDFTQFAASSSFGGAMSLSSSQYGSGLSSTEMESDIKVCRICMDKEIDAIFLPCGHVYCCSQCAKSVKVCPFCRQQVEKISHAYLPF